MQPRLQTSLGGYGRRVQYVGREVIKSLIFNHLSALSFTNPYFIGENLKITPEHWNVKQTNFLMKNMIKSFEIGLNKFPIILGGPFSSNWFKTDAYQRIYCFFERSHVTVENGVWNKTLYL